MTNPERQCDVLIIGSSMAGGCLARQLKIKHPDLDIVVLENRHWNLSGTMP
jgi:choline dehydrogenase-like flavoprotein